MVSLIQSNYRGMGSGMTPGMLGFVLQDRGEMFSLQKGMPMCMSRTKGLFIRSFRHLSQKTDSHGEFRGNGR